MLKSARLGCLGFGIALLLAEAVLAHYPGESHSPNGASGTGRSFYGIGGVGGGSGIVGNSAVQNSQPGLGNQKNSVPNARNTPQGAKWTECIDPRIADTDTWNCNSDGNPSPDGCGKAPASPSDILRMSVVGVMCPCSPCGSGDGGGGGGCSSASCGTPKQEPAVISTFASAKNVVRTWLPNNRATNSSFSPGYYSQFDSQVHIFPGDSELLTNHTISYFSSFAHRVYHGEDSQLGGDGVYQALQNNHFKELKTLNAAGQLVLDPLQAVTVEVTHWNGGREVFQVIDLDPSSAQVLVGRLTKRIDLDGRELTVTYKNWTASEIQASPARQWQINTVSDSYGFALTFTYGTTQQSGRWSVTRIDRNDGQFTTFQYTNGSLSSNTYPDGRTATFAYGQDAVAQTATMTTFDPAAGSRTLKLHLTNDYMTLSVSGQAQVMNQPVGIYRMRELANGDIDYMMVPPVNANLDERFYFLGGNRAVIGYGNAREQYFESWSTVPPSTPPSMNYVGIVGTLASLISGPDASTSQAQLRKGQLPSITSDQSIQKTYLYDIAGNVTKVTYVADGTFEAYAYNTNSQLTRYRDRVGNVVKYIYDAQGRMTKKQEGLVEQSNSDVQTSSFAEWSFEYYPSTHVNKGLLKTEFDPLYSSSSPTLHRRDFEYNAAGLMTKRIDSADMPGGQRPEYSYTYDTAGRLLTTSEPDGNTNTNSYTGAQCQPSSLMYPDGSSVQTLYAPAGAPDAGRLLKTKDRMNVVTSYTYDAAGRVATVTVGSEIDANILDGAPGTAITDPNLKQLTQYTYLDDSSDLKTQVKVDGATTDYVYDVQNRVVEVKQYPNANKMLSSKKAYQNNQLLYDEDPYGRRKYYGYRASDGTLIRTISCTVPEQTFANFAAVWSQTRDLGPNAKYIVHDAIRDATGQLTQIIDGRGIETRHEYDSRGREINKRQAFGTAVEARTETLYDLVGNVIEVRSPRYFDAADTLGFNKAREQWTYTGRNLQATHTEAPGTPEAATESFAYNIEGKQLSRTDFNGSVWTTIDTTCCGKQIGSQDPLGHGSISNTDSQGRVVHTATVSEITTHTDFSNPIDAKTLGESTTRYDVRGRAIAATTWLIPRGVVDVNNPPIAGLGSVPVSDGFTTFTMYDSNLSDGIGLDSAGGVSVVKQSGANPTGTFNVSLSAAIAKLADTQANGGAGLTFNASSPGKATVTVNAEDEVSFAISDAAGRSVMSGKLDNYKGTVNNLVTWSCRIHDLTSNLAGYGTLLESRSIDALGYATKQRSDGDGRILRSFDQLDNATSFTYDAGGNQLSVRDPNNVGADMVYDALGRNTQRTDTFGDVTKSEYDRAGNAIKQIDAKNKNTLIAFDPRGRRKSTTDRISAVTTFAYTALGQLLSLTDAENQTTAYTYDSRGSKLTEQYPDHVANAAIGTPGYGIVTFFFYDQAGRVLRKQDQAGDTCTFNYDLAGRMTSRNYRTAANSPSGAIADTDAFTFDRAGRMLTATSGRYANTVGYAYDPAGRKATEALTVSNVTYTTGQAYNARNEVTTITYPNNTTSTRSHHATGTLNQLGLDGSTVSTRSYDAGRRQTTDVLSNGITETHTYRNDNLLTAINYSNTSLGDMVYTWDANKNKTSESITGVMSGYGFTAAGTTYDNEDRLTGFARAATSGPALLSQSWNLTAVGDWTSVTTNGTAQSRAHGPMHELLTAGGQTVDTDGKGNITTLPANLRPAGATTAMNLNWDFDNKLRSVDIDANGTADVSFQYDALGRRVARTGTGNSMVFVQMDQQTIADYPVGGAATTPTFRYVYASYIDEPVVRKGPTSTSTVHFYHRNHQHSVTAITTSTGAIAERYAYTAYGQPKLLDAAGTEISETTLTNRYTYTGREWDATLALHHFRARWMSPIAGRFLGRDPIGYRDSRNIYSLMAARVTTRMDPTGRLSIKQVGGKVWTPFSNKCVDDSTISWKFTLSKKATDICEGTGGILVQKITIECSGEDCPKDIDCDASANPKTAEYWESWYVPPNEDTYGLDDPAHDPNDLGPRKVTDTSGIVAHDKKCGKYKLSGEVRFYCMDITEADWLEMGDSPKPKVDACFKDAYESGDLPGWTQAPDFWERGNGNDGVAKRWHSRDWDCCAECSPVKDSADAYPKFPGPKK